MAGASVKTLSFLFVYNDTVLRMESSHLTHVFWLLPLQEG